MKVDQNEFIVKAILSAFVCYKYNISIKDITEEHEGITQQIIAQEEGLV